MSIGQKVVKNIIFMKIVILNKDVTTEIFEGKVADAYAHKHIDELCKICENRAVKAKEAGFVLYYTLA